MADAKSVRLDIYVEDGKETVYNIEMQTAENRNLPKRTRYYQGMIDLNILEKGDNYKNMSRGYDEGDRKRAISVAMRMIEANKLSSEGIALYSGLTLEQVLELEKELQPV